MDKREAVWAHIDRAFARPMTGQDGIAEYVSTQIIAELFKREGFDGVAYKSNFGEDGYNVALFDLNAADLINCFLSEVTKVEMAFEERSDPYFVTKYYANKKNDLHKILRDRRKAVKSPTRLPTWVKPQLATLVKKAPDGLEWLHEGSHAACSQGGACRLGHLCCRRP